MHPHHYIPLVLNDFPELSRESKSALELLIRQMLMADRRSKLGELQMQFSAAQVCEPIRMLLDTVMLDNSDLSDSNPRLPLTRIN